MKKTKRELLESMPIDGDKKTARKIANNTLRYDTPRGYGIQLHNTEIIRVENGLMFLFSGGYKTYTTKSRLNDYIPSPFSIQQESFVWYIWNYQTQEKWLFKDGIAIDLYTQEVLNYANDTDTKNLYLSIKEYSAEYINALWNGWINKPSNRDCKLCRFMDDKPTKDTGHLERHIKDNSFVPSLLLVATRHFSVSPYANEILQSLWNRRAEKSYLDGIASEQLTKSLTKFLCRKMGI